MPHHPSPWLRRGRGWYVQIDGRQIFLGRNKKAAHQRYHELMCQPAQPVNPAKAEKPFVVVCDEFLDWNQRNRSLRTYSWYRERLQSFVNHLRQAAPNISVHDVRPLHVDGWVSTRANRVADRCRWPRDAVGSCRRTRYDEIVCLARISDVS